jgi:hypothetical protein
MVISRDVMRGIRRRTEMRNRVKMMGYA